MISSKLARIKRAQTQFFEVLKRKSHPTDIYFELLSNSGISYEVIITLNPLNTKLICSCPDYRCNYQICKHIYYILMKYGYTKKLEELNIISDKSLFYSLLAALTPKRIKRYDDCPICMEKLLSYGLQYCESGCGNCFHKKCLDAMKVRTCPLCRHKL
jgi:hypothetical protein